MIILIWGFLILFFLWSLKVILVKILWKFVVYQKKFYKKQEEGLSSLEKKITNIIKNCIREALEHQVPDDINSQISINNTFETTYNTLKNSFNESHKTEMITDSFLVYQERLQVVLENSLNINFKNNFTSITSPRSLLDYIKIQKK
jgi:hypothetical protein